MKKIIILTICLLLSLQGCGYSFYGRSGAPSGDISTVFVRNIVNTSSEANVETMLRNAIIDQLLRSGSARVATGKDAATVTIVSNIRSVSIAPLSLNIGNTAAQARITMVLDAELVRNADGATLWKMKGFSKCGDYSISTQPQGINLTEAQKQEALTALCRDVSEHLYSLMFSGF